MVLCALAAFNLGTPAAPALVASSGAGLGVLARQRIWQLFLLSMLLPGPQILLYFVGWILIPSE